jgi:hydrogenase/urease accessory protein HupE
MELFTSFLQVGLNHILEGYDHLLFLLGLIIVADNLRGLFPVITAFTITHSTTLILSALGILSLNPSITEALIAVSIVYVGVENLYRKKMKLRWLISGGFGLVHGAGFSGHLTEMLKNVLGMNNIWFPLIGFNVGIELGQLIVISLVYPLMYLMKNEKIKNSFVQKMSIGIAATGLFLLALRIFNPQ